MFRALDPDADATPAGSASGLVAVKLFRIDLAPDRVHRLVAELERLIEARLAHPAIAAPVAAGIAGAQAYLATELVQADSLDTVIRDNGPAPLGHAIKVAAQLAGAIDYAAAVQVGHGALHPRDVLVSAEETRITGFGVAQALERIGVAVPLRRPYAAPERVGGGRWARDADVFALAAITYEMLTGRRIAGPGSEGADALGTVPAVDVALVRAVFARALAADPRHRFETALQFVDALEQTALDSAEPSAAPREAIDPRVEAEPRLPLDEPPLVLPDEVPGPAPDLAPAIDDEASPAAAPRPRIDAPLPAAPLAAIDAAPTPERAPDPADLDLAAAEQERFSSVESAPVQAPEPVKDLPLSPQLSAQPLAPSPDQRPSLIERSGSAMWPLALALIVGLALGFAGGYGVATRQPAAQAPPPSAGQVAAEPIAPPELPIAPAGQEPPPAPSSPAAQPQGTAATLPPPAIERRGAAEAGRILVRSTPEGARVYVDGRERGRTPVAVGDLAAGTHRIRIIREGYLSSERRVVLSARQPSQSMDVALARAIVEPPTGGAPEAFVGALTVESRPTGAKVYLDGRLIGTTPTRVPRVSAGDHVVRLEHDGYRRWSSAVRVVSGERNRVTASLEK